MTQWDTVIGLEVHAQLLTQSKLFSNAPNNTTQKANINVDWLDAALPGTLPVLNKTALRYAIRFGLATRAEIQNLSYFERKNYFYPDLPKGYQISQYKRPIIKNGTLPVTLPSGDKKEIQIYQAHLEEDAGKSIHDAYPGFTVIDLNRAGTPLLEIVTTPCMNSPTEAVSYLKTLHQLLIFLEICDGNMQEGSFRCDVNISLKSPDSQTLGTRVELKNLNSFRFIEQAILYEQKRQAQMLEKNQPIIKETRLYCPNKQKTFTMREKEEENDYRYFACPDLLPIQITKEMLNSIEAEMPMLPLELKKRLLSYSDLIEDDIEYLLTDPALTHFFIDTASQTTANAKQVLNWIKGAVATFLNQEKLSWKDIPIHPQELAIVLDNISIQALTSNNAKQVVIKLCRKEGTAQELIKQALSQDSYSETELQVIITKLLAENPKQVQQYIDGNPKIIGFFMGKIMQACKGQAEPAIAQKILKDTIIK